MAKFKNLLDIILKTKKESNYNIDLKFSKDDIFKICEIHPKDKMFDYNIGYISNWINAYLKYHIPGIKVLLYDELIFITDNLNVKYDNIHTKYPSSNMYKHKFDFEIKRLYEKDFRNYKNCGMSNTIIPGCGAYIITTDEGQYIGSSINMCNRLRQQICLSNNKEQFRKTFRKITKIRSPIKIITIYECPDENQAKYLEEKLIEELNPILNSM